MPFINDLLQYKNDYFVETGTYEGETTRFVSENGFKNVISIEMSDVFYDNCVEKLKHHENIKIIHGNSRYDLYKTIQDINTPITFWLDGHWSGVVNIGFDPECHCPVLYELEQIKNHPIKTHTIMIDDIRLMNGDHFKVQKEEIEQKIMEINPNYTIKYYDDYTSKNDILVAYIQK